jgi:SAM-dependent methyltransferase
MIADPVLPTWSRWRWLSRQRMSLLRALEYEQLAALRLSGATLDVGGGAQFEYHGLIDIKGTTHSVNLARSVAPTVIANLNASLPFASASYDNVISLNTLEHIEDDRLALAEMIRVLKPGGHVHITVPFLYRQHGRYGDFHRHTAQWWEYALHRAGLAAEHLYILPLVWSPIASVLAQFPWFGGGFKGRLLRSMVLITACVPGAPKRSRAIMDMPLGYYIRGRKSHESGGGA